jgi:hypothetical protein
MKNIPASMQHSQKFIAALHWLLPLGRMTRTSLYTQDKQ